MQQPRCQVQWHREQRHINGCARVGKHQHVIHSTNCRRMGCATASSKCPVTCCQCGSGAGTVASHAPLQVSRKASRNHSRKEEARCYDPAGGWTMLLLLPLQNTCLRPTCLLEGKQHYPLCCQQQLQLPQLGPALLRPHPAAAPQLQLLQATGVGTTRSAAG